jgi:phospholipid/cholesterol/gamma-HCH transport system permease protein
LSEKNAVKQLEIEMTGVDAQARIEVVNDQLVQCQGRWTVYHLAYVEQRLAAMSWPKVPELVWDLSGIEAMDTSGAWMLQRTVGALEENGQRVELQSVSSDIAGLLETTARKWPGRDLLRSRRPGWLETIGRFVAERGARAWAALGFMGEGALGTVSLLFHPRRIRWRVLLHNVQVDGFNALPITGLLTFLMGVVIAYQGSEQLKTFGANIFIVDLVGISLLREIAPLVTAILVAGRSGSAYTAQIGTMRVTEELDALRALGISPMSLLVIPRAMALVIVLPLLTVFADVVGVFGGMLIASSQLGITFTEFLNRFDYAVAMRHYVIGIGKTPVFAIIVALVGCYQGLQVAGGVDSVGRQTTISVVQAIFLVIVADAFFSVLFSWWGI